jgi:hypothetical protein
VNGFRPVTFCWVRVGTQKTESYSIGFAQLRVKMVTRIFVRAILKELVKCSVLGVATLFSTDAAVKEVILMFDTWCFSGWGPY